MKVQPDPAVAFPTEILAAGGTGITSEPRTVRSEGHVDQGS